MPKDFPIRDSFGLLPEPEGRWGSFGVSMVTNLTIMALVVLLTAAVHKVEKQKYIEHMVFVEKNPPPPPPKPIIPKVKVIAPPQPQVVKLEPPKIVMPKIQPPPELPKPVKLDTPGSTQAAARAAEGSCASAAAQGRTLFQPEAYGGSQQPGETGRQSRRFQQSAGG